MSNEEQATNWPQSAILQEDSSSWIQKNGLYARGLTLDQVLPTLGFKQSEGFIPNGGKVTSTYNEGLFTQHPDSKGNVYNVCASESQIDMIQHRLVDTISLLTSRMKWLNTKSRLVFGVIAQKRVCIIVETSATDSTQLHPFISAVQTLLTEQVSKLQMFNMIRCTGELCTFSNVLVNVSSETIEGCITWLKQGQPTSVRLTKNIIEAVTQGTSLENVDSVYLVTLGEGALQAYSQLLDTLEQAPVPVHISVYNCKSKQAIDDYTTLSNASNGKLHLYNTSSPPASPPTSQPSTRPSSAVSSTSSETSNTRARPPTNPREDVLLVWKELEEARNILADVQAIQLDRTTSLRGEQPNYIPPTPKRDEYLSSQEWIAIHGLKVNQLLFGDLMKGLAFQHCEGVLRKSYIVSSLEHTSKQLNEEELELISYDKIVGAQYCRGFVHLRWNDGRIIHAHLNERPYQEYRTKVLNLIKQCETRMKWLKNGSRELFGTILENNIIIAVDTSSSMEGRLPLVKRKLKQLVQEQLIHKNKFSVIKFSTEAVAWRDHLVPVTPQNMCAVKDWVVGLEAGGSTDTLSALRKATGTKDVEAVYLLTDGRPDQSPEVIFSHIQQWKQLPIHTISFNCADSKANSFLSKLAAITGGRYHYYSEDISDPEGPVTHHSEDLQILIDEVSLAREQLSKSEQFRTECAKLQHTGKGKLQSSTPKSHLRTKNSLTSLSKWLSKNDLISRHLTLMDALGPASVPHNPHHVQILDKKIKGKVFEGILSTAHITGDGHVRLINPCGVDLQNYTDKIDVYTEECERVIMKYAFAKLPTDVRKNLSVQLNLQKGEVPIYNEHKLLVCQRLEEGGCGLVLEEIQKVEEEIERAKSFKEQARALLEEVRKENKQSDLLESVDGLQSPSLLSLSSGAISVSESLINDIVHDKAHEQGEMKRKREMKDVRGQSLRRGQHVIAIDPSDGVYHPGIVSTQPRNGFCEITFTSKQKCKVLTKHLIPLGGSAPCPVVHHGDHVLVRVRLNSKNSEDKDMYLPGMVSAPPENPRLAGAVYSVTILGGRVLTCKRHAIVKIGRSRYQQACDEMVSKTKMAEAIIKEDERVESKDTILSSLYKLSHTPVPIPKHLPVSSRHAQTQHISMATPEYLPVSSRHSQTQHISMATPEHLPVSSRHSQTQHMMMKQTIEQNTQTETEINLLSKSPPTTGLIMERGTSPSPIFCDVGTNTGPLMENKGVWTMPEMKEVATVTEWDEEEEKHESKVLEQSDFQDNSNDLTIGMLGPTHNSTPIVSPTRKHSSTDHSPSHCSKDTPTKPSIGEQVLACWPDDGWYYRGILIEEEYGSWKVQDANDVIETIQRDDIITDQDDADANITVGDPVIALHMSYSHSYAPGRVNSILVDGFHFMVELYDGSQGCLPRHEIYSTSEDKYKDSVQFILTQEQAWVDKPVIGRSDRDGLFHQGVVIKKLDNSQQCLIKWVNGTTEILDIADMFGELTRRRPLYIGDFVIALPSNDLTKPKGVCYPGRIEGVQNSELIIQLYNQEYCLASGEHCFWISDVYYYESIALIK